MIDIMKNTIEQHQLIEPGDKIVVAVSGGPDSIALLHGLWVLRNEYSLTLYVCHLNHMLRGEESDGDAEYVKEISDKLGLESFIFSEDIEAFSKKIKMSFEEAAREARYKLFDYVMEVTKSSKIAIAQNMNDQAETVLMRLARGSGLEGLTAIKHKRDKIIRPLLDVPRDKIEKYCEENELITRTDHTNFETTYTRNKIRLELIPYFKENLNENIIQQIHLTTELLQADLDYITDAVDRRYHDLVIENENILELRLKDLKHSHIAIFSRLIRKLIEHFSGDLKGVSSYHIDEIVDLCKNSNHGSYKIVKKNVKFEISYDHLRVYDIRFQGNEIEPILFDIGDELSICGGTLKALELSFSDRHDVNSMTIDKHKIVGDLHVRTRKPGDRFTPLGMKGSKKLKDFFIDLKIPITERDKVLLLCDEKEIIWVIGYRMSELYKVSSNTKERVTFVFEKKNIQ